MVAVHAAQAHLLADAGVTLACAYKSSRRITPLRSPPFEARSAAAAPQRAGVRRRRSSRMAGWVPKAAPLLGRELKYVLIIRPQIRSLSSDAATMIKSAGFNYLKLDYDFGHPPFGPYYGFDVPLGSDGLPEWVDWSLVPGAVCRAKDQANLGICFAVAPVVSLSSLHFLKSPGPVASRSPVVLSLQQVIDCMPGLKFGPDGKAINSVYSMDVLDYIIRKGGLVPEACYPYLGVQGECKSPEGPLFSCDAWRRVIPNSMYALKYAVAHQPVIIDIRMEDLMRVLFVEHGLVSGYNVPVTSYQWGVITGPSSSLTDHVMVTIGYGEVPTGVGYGEVPTGVGYGEVPTGVPHAGIKGWWCQNSWGEEWGYNGKCWIEMTDDQDGGPLGIYTNPHLPLIWNGEEQWGF